MMDYKLLALVPDKSRSKPSGFSLIEVIIYIALFGSMVAVMAAVITIMIQTDAKITATSEVQEITTFVMNRMEQAFEEAHAIDLPINGSGSTLRLLMRTPTTDPTTFEVQGEILQILEGSGFTRSNLTSSRVRVTNFTVTRIPSVTGGAVRIQYTIVSNFPNIKQQSTVTFTQSLSLHK